MWRLGRAKKRLLYNRRFLTQVTTFGGKRRVSPPLLHPVLALYTIDPDPTV